MEISNVIAQNLKKLRRERNLSLGQLSELCGVSKVMLSQIEKGESNPTINTIWKITEALHISYTALLNDNETEVDIISKADSPMQKDGGYRIYCCYPSSPVRNFEWFQMELDGGSSHTSVGHPKKTEEYIYVLSGRLTMEIEDKTFVLETDSSLRFQADRKHIYKNTGEDMVCATMLNYYPIE